ncbi:MAG TPA: CBS domain-containing protein, partial [Candidatus Goldiibacteriota bacterium]|nr:CBS domain-containing protein [Candidatus Goldiibacteriota bacterium]
KMVSDFLREGLDGGQAKLFGRLMKNAQTADLKGFKAIVTYARMNEYIKGAAEAASRLMEINGADAIISIAQMGNRIFISGRSNDQKIDVRKAIAEFGGGGHRTAAAAVIQVKKGVTIKSVKDRVYENLISGASERYTVRDIMSSPVRAIAPSLTMEDAYKICIRFNNNGLPVIKDGKLAGFITKEDIEKGIRHRLGTIPVSGYMSTNVITADIDMPIPKAQEIMLKNNIGHLPVVDGGVLKGIVTRSDILAYLYEEKPLKKDRIVFEEKDINMSSLMAEKLPPDIFELVRKIGVFADAKGIQAYLVGGMVRDMFLGARDVDVDITVEGDGMEFAKFLADRMGGSFKGFERFKTGKVFLKDGRRIDVTSARAEFYEFPAALPEIEFTPIRYDLFRRDFTINAMAICVNARSFGRFIDYFNGYGDLKEGVIRTLYNMSFIDDPTRILRAIRFEVRHGFKIEENTLRFIKETLKYNVFDNLPGERIMDELFLIFGESNPVKMLRRADSLGVLEKINPGLYVTERSDGTQKRAEKLLLEKEFKDADRRLVYFLVMCDSLKEDAAQKLIARLKASKRISRALMNVKKAADAAHELDSEIKKSRLHSILKNMGTEELCCLAALSAASEKNIKTYMREHKSVSLSIGGRDLKKLGLSPGPRYREILEKVAEAKIDGKVRTKEEEKEMARKLLRRKNGTF